MSRRTAHDADDFFKADLAALGFRHRRGHDLRRTFITLAQVDGARRDLLKVITHGPAADDIVSLYTSLPWPALCAEVAKLQMELPPAVEIVPAIEQTSDAPCKKAARKIPLAAAAATLATVSARASEDSSVFGADARV